MSTTTKSPTTTPENSSCRRKTPINFATGYSATIRLTETAWSDGWFHTGDRVVRNDDGYFRFVDRLKDSIRRRGENISAWEVEQALESHPAIAAAAAVPVPSELGEDDVMAFVVPNNGATSIPKPSSGTANHGSRTSRSHVTSSSLTPSRSRRTGRFGSTSSANVASRRSPGTTNGQA